jgi:hypothetical protein
MIPRGLIGVVHLAPMPGDPAHREGGFEGVRQRAEEDVAALRAGGVDAVIVENFGSAPFVRGTRGDPLPPHQVALLALVASDARRAGLPCGVNCLRNDARAAIGIAAASGLDFVRVNVHTGAYVTDQGLIEGDAAETLRYRRALGADHVAICADVLVKHASPVSPLSMEQAVDDCFGRGLADAVIVTGDATGAAIDEDLLERARKAAAGRPLLAGSGMTPDRATAIAPYVEGAIVGTWIKEQGDVRAKVDPERTRSLVEATRGRFRSG